MSDFRTPAELRLINAVLTHLASYDLDSLPIDLKTAVADVRDEQKVGRWNRPPAWRVRDSGATYYVNPFSLLVSFRWRIVRAWESWRSACQEVSGVRIGRYGFSRATNWIVDHYTIARFCGVSLLRYDAPAWSRRLRTWPRLIAERREHAFIEEACSIGIQSGVGTPNVLLVPGTMTYEISVMGSRLKATQIQLIYQGDYILKKFSVMCERAAQVQA